MKLFKVGKSLIITLLGIIFSVAVITPTKGYMLESASAQPAHEVADMFKYNLFDADKVQLVDQGEFARGKALNKAYLLSLSPDRLLVNFKKNSGLTTTAKEYGGWFQNGVGEGFGEIDYITALCYLYADEKDPEYLSRINYMIDELYDCQQNYAQIDPDNSGYLSASPISNLESLEKYGSANWCYIYNYAKNLIGYYNAYFYTNNQKAYEIWTTFGRFLAERTVAYSNEMMQRMFVREYGDISVAFFQLYLETGEEVFKNAGIRYCDPNTFNKLLNNEDPFAYIHCNRSIPILRGYIYGYFSTGDEQYLTAAINGFHIMTDHRAFANGNTSEMEDLHPEYETDTKGFHSCETCCAYNYMKVCDLLYRITGDAYYLDYYENLLYNQVLASIDWDTGMKTYYVSMDNGFYKAYHSPENAFWCCTCTGMESFAKFNQTIYYHGDNEMIVNFFINSETIDNQTGLGIRQQHDFPNKPVVDFVITKGANTKLRIRVPSWVSGDVQVSYNGKLIDSNIHEGYIVLNREFIENDNIKVYFPMDFKLSRLDSITQPHSDAIMYGPIMMVGVIESIGEISPILNNADIGPSYDNKVKSELFYSGDSIFDNVRKVDDLQYVIKADNQEVLIKAFFKCYREKYIVYWDIYKTGSEDYNNFLNQTSLDESHLIDDIDVGYYFSETPHNYFNNNKTWLGNYATERNRGLVLDGYFGYTMKVEPNVQNILMIKHFGTDTGYRYSISFNDVETYSVDVDYVGLQFYWKSFEIPTVYTNGKNNIKVTITCTKGTLTTGIYEMKVIRNDLPLFNEYPLNITAGNEQIIELNDYLFDNFTLTGTGNVQIYGLLNDVFTLIYEGATNKAIKGYRQCEKIKIVAVSDASFTLSVYGAKVGSIEKIEHNVASDDNYYPTQYATVNLVDAGQVKLRILWNEAHLTKGTQSGKAPLFNTELEVEYDIKQNSLNDGLVLYYDFEGEGNEITDRSGNGLNAELHGTMTKVDGKYGSGLNLKGDSYLSLPQIAGITNEITLSAWVKLNDTNNAFFQRLFDLGKDTDHYLTTTINGYNAAKNGGAISSTGQQIYSLKKDVWYHATFVVKNNVAISFINGVEVSRNEQFNIDLSTINDFTDNLFGKSHVEFTPLLNAVVDEIRIYNYALSKEQIEGLSKVSDLSLNEFASTDIHFETVEEEEIDITYDIIDDEPEDKPIEIDVVIPTEEDVPPKEKKDNTGLIIGLSVGGAALAAGGVTAAIVINKKRKGKK